ncbi:unnamed protein product [Prorocentrum cordatum]|nr:unnamed protein product [Polarella glacialis]
MTKLSIVLKQDEVLALLSRLSPSLLVKVRRASRLFVWRLDDARMQQLQQHLIDEFHLVFQDVHELCERGEAECVWLLLSQGMSVKARDHESHTLLQKATHSYRTPVIKLLVERGANVNAKGAYGYTPLHEACYIGSLDVVSCLLGAKALMRFVREGDRNAELFYLFSQELQDQARRGEATEGQQSPIDLTAAANSWQRLALGTAQDTSEARQIATDFQPVPPRCQRRRRRSQAPRRMGHQSEQKGEGANRPPPRARPTIAFLTALAKAAQETAEREGPKQGMGWATNCILEWLKAVVQAFDQAARLETIAMFEVLEARAPKKGEGLMAGGDRGGAKAKATFVINQHPQFRAALSKTEASEETLAVHDGFRPDRLRMAARELLARFGGGKAKSAAGETELERAVERQFQQSQKTRTNATTTATAKICGGRIARQSSKVSMKRRSTDESIRLRTLQDTPRGRLLIDGPPPPLIAGLATNAGIAMDAMTGLSRLLAQVAQMQREKLWGALVLMKTQSSPCSAGGYAGNDDGPARASPRRESCQDETRTGRCNSDKIGKAKCVPRSAGANVERASAAPASTAVDIDAGIVNLMGYRHKIMLSLSRCRGLHVKMDQERLAKEEDLMYLSDQMGSLSLRIVCEPTSHEQSDEGSEKRTERQLPWRGPEDEETRAPCGWKVKRPELCTDYEKIANGKRRGDSQEHAKTTHITEGVKEAPAEEEAENTSAELQKRIEERNKKAQKPAASSAEAGAQGAGPQAATGAPSLQCDLDFGRLAELVAGGAGAGGVGAGGVAPPLGAVLRALLQRLASAESRVSRRRGFLVSLACFDVLGVRSHPEARLRPSRRPAAVAELTLGVLAVLACEAVGRSYIVANLACVEKVVQLIKAETLESSMHIQALAALQRLSLRREPQDLMIKLGMMEWIVGVLGWHGDAIQGMPTEFTLEFASAMLMNLAVRSAGKRKCLELDTLTVALNLMEHWNPQIRTHINGVLRLPAMPATSALDANDALPFCGVQVVHTCPQSPPGGHWNTAAAPEWTLARVATKGPAGVGDASCADSSPSAVRTIQLPEAAANQRCLVCMDADVQARQQADDGDKPDAGRRCLCGAGARHHRAAGNDSAPGLLEAPEARVGGAAGLLASPDLPGRSAMSPASLRRAARGAARSAGAGPPRGSPVASRRALGMLPPRRPAQLLCHGARRWCAQQVAGEAAFEPGRVPVRLLARHFMTCAVPMVGFGFMDNTILIRTGDAIERYFGVAYNLSGLSAAAAGQVFSDFSGVLFGGVVESASRCFILPPEFSAAQASLRLVQVVGTAGAACGVVAGCLLGMANLLTMDLEEAERLKRMAELEEIFTVVMQSARDTIGTNMGSIFLVDEDSGQLWTRVQTGTDESIKIPISERSIAGWVCLHNEHQIIPNAYEDSRFNPEVDKKFGCKTENMLAVPVRSMADPAKVIGVIQLINKEAGPFDDHDVKACRMLSIHVSVFLSKCE